MNIVKAEENQIKTIVDITEVSYSYALGKLLFLKGEPERARKYLQVAIDLGGDTKYKKFAEELLQKIISKQYNSNINGLIT